MKKAILCIVLLLFLSSPGFTQGEDVRKKNFNVRKDVVLEGYDPVSYFGERPQEGKEDFQYVYRGIVYYFVNASNLAKFKSNPGRYEPAYGGWCAYAMGEKGEKVKIDPETYKIADGKLYLFYNFWGNNTLTDWNKNENQLRTQGDRNWLKFVQ